jgi:general secretion pathway protein D
MKILAEKTRSKNSAMLRRSGIVFLMLMTVTLSGCAGLEAYREGQALLASGQAEQGLSKLEEAVRLEPKNAEYRIALANHRLSILNRLIAAAETARLNHQLDEAEKFFLQALALDVHHPMAQQGLDELNKLKRHLRIVAEVETLMQKGASMDFDAALEKLRLILAERPDNIEVRNLKARIAELQSASQKREESLSATFRKPVTLEFRDAPLKSVLEVISRVSNLNFFYDQDIRPDLKATIFAKNTTVEDAMRLILVTNQLEYRILNENSILVYPNTPQKLREYQTLAMRSFYLTNADPKAIANSIKTLVKTKDLIVDERLGLVIMRDTPEAIRVAERIVRLQDLTDPEVMLEVEIMEIQRSRLLELGIQWPGQMTLTPLQTSGTPLTIADLRNLTQATTQVNIGGVILNANKEDQNGNILANPRIRVRNREKAKIQIGDRVPVITTTSTSTGFVSESVNYVDVGLKLEVEPNIYLDDEVAIKVNLEVSSLVREIMSSSGTLSYQIGSRGATTVLRLRNGETQILAGLINDEDRVTSNKVPLLGELPIAGRLFGSQKDDSQRSEILLSITPRIVRSIRRPDLVDAEFESGTESAIGVRSLRLSSATESSARDDMQYESTTRNEEEPSEPVALRWMAPEDVSEGEVFSVILQISSTEALRRIPLLLEFNPQYLEVTEIQEGSFFRQSGGQSRFDVRHEAATGKIYATISRIGDDPSGTSGEGSLLMAQLKAVKAVPSTALRILSATPEPTPKNPVMLPDALNIRIAP